jgi:hypothetical protein
MWGLSVHMACLEKDFLSPSTGVTIPAKARDNGAATMSRTRGRRKGLKPGIWRPGWLSVWESACASNGHMFFNSSTQQGVLSCSNCHQLPDRPGEPSYILVALHHTSGYLL